MDTKLGRVLRLAFDRRDSSGDAEPEAPASAEVEFSAFAEDCRLYGRLRMDAERLTDMLNDHDEILLLDVRIEALADGTVHDVAGYAVLGLTVAGLLAHDGPYARLYNSQFVAPVVDVV